MLARVHIHQIGIAVQVVEVFKQRQIQRLLDVLGLNALRQMRGQIDGQLLVADGMLEDGSKKILGRAAGVQVGKTSGLAGIAYWLNDRFHLEGEKAFTKHDPLVVALKEWVDKEYEDGRVSVLSDQELFKKIEELSGGALRGDGRV